MEKMLRITGFFDKDAETMPLNKMVQYKNQRLCEIIQHAYNNSQAIRTIMNNNQIQPQDVQRTEDLTKFPILHKQKLIQLQKENPPFGGFLAVPEERLNWIFFSPGPISDPYVIDERIIRGAASAFYSCGFRPGDRVMITWSYHLVPAGLVLDTVLRHLGCTVLPTGVGNTDFQVFLMHTAKVNGFVGTASFLMDIFKKARDMGLDPRRDFHLEVAMAGVEPGGGHIREIFEKEYNILTGDFYVTADVGIIAYECRERNGMHLIINSIVEIVDPINGKVLPHGEIGEIVVTPFNHTYPLIRLGTGDLGSLDITPCPCGRTAPRIPKILGRVDETLKIRGMFIYKRVSDEALRDFSEISRYQIIVTRQEHRDHVLLKVETKGEEANKITLRGRIIETFHSKCKIKVDEVEYLSPDALGDKYKVFDDQRIY